MMIEDMTFNELKYIKSNISSFIVEIKKQSQIYKYEYKQYDIDFFTFIAKHIIFIKYLIDGDKNTYVFKVLISDFYYYILSIIKKELRYMYVNERSIIENYMRIIIGTSVENNHVTERLFNEMKEKKYIFDFTDSNYSLIKSEYSISCQYIHGGNILNENLASVFEECFSRNKKVMKEDKNKYYIRMGNILKIYDKLLISENIDYVNGCFHRRKSILEYLIGAECLELLFIGLNN